MWDILLRMDNACSAQLKKEIPSVENSITIFVLNALSGTTKTLLEGVEQSILLAKGILKKQGNAQTAISASSLKEMTVLRMKKPFLIQIVLNGEKEFV